MAEVPAGKHINGFTGELEDDPEVLLAPSPADQRKLSAPPHTAPLAESAKEIVDTIGNDDAGVDLESHRGGSLTEDALIGKTPVAYVAQHDTPIINEQPELDDVPVQRETAPSANEAVVQEGDVNVVNAGAQALEDDTQPAQQDTSEDEHQEVMTIPEPEASEVQEALDDEETEQTNDDVPVPTTGNQEVVEDTDQQA